MIVYTILNNVIVRIRQQEEPYTLLPNEYSSSVWYQKPHFNGSNVVETITQQEIDDRAEAEAEELVNQELLIDLNEGIKAANKLKVYLYRNLTAVQYKTAKILLLPTWTALMMGNWDLALDEITIVDDANSTTISIKIKTHIENYLGTPKSYINKISNTIKKSITKTKVTKISKSLKQALFCILGLIVGGIIWVLINYSF